MARLLVALFGLVLMIVANIMQYVSIGNLHQWLAVTVLWVVGFLICTYCLAIWKS